MAEFDSKCLMWNKKIFENIDKMNKRAIECEKNVKIIQSKSNNILEVKKLQQGIIIINKDEVLQKTNELTNKICSNVEKIFNEYTSSSHQRYLKVINLLVNKIRNLTTVNKGFLLIQNKIAEVKTHFEKSKIQIHKIVERTQLDSYKMINDLNENRRKTLLELKDDSEEKKQQIKNLHQTLHGKNEEVKRLLKITQAINEKTEELSILTKKNSELEEQLNNLRINFEESKN